MYDKEIGYCQGFSFIMAVLLLHIPEEQSFAVLVKIMCEYELREFFKPGLQVRSVNNNKYRIYSNSSRGDYIFRGLFSPKIFVNF